MSNHTRVLVVDDEESILFVFEEFFRRRGDYCKTAPDGRAALAILEKEDFDVLLTDMSMPHLNGLDLIRSAKAVRPHTVCVLMSGVGTRGDIIAAMKIGVFDFLDKPFREMSACSMVIDRAAERSRLLRERVALLEDLRRQNIKLETSLDQLHKAYERLRQQGEMLKSDLVQAQRVQRRLLPLGFPHVSGLEMFGYFAPCERLGGDFFGAIPLGDGRLAVYLVDVAGHGVSAAMITVILRELIHAQILMRPKDEVFLSPDRALTYLNQGLMDEAFDPPILVTIVYVVLDARTGRAVCGCAGHPPPILVSGSGGGRLLKVTGPVLGMELPDGYESAEVFLESGDFLLLYSDGLSEARDLRGREYTEARLAKHLSAQHGRSAFEVGAFLENTMTRHLGSSVPADDMTFLVIGRPDAAAKGRKGISRQDGEIVPDSVKVVLPEKIRRSLPAARGEIAGGVTEDGCVLELSGVGTWQLAPRLRAILKQADSQNAGVVHVNLKACEGLDSTLMGLLFQMAPRVILHEVQERAEAQLRETGIWERFQLSPDPAPPIMAPIRPALPDASREACSDLILSAHEALMDVSDQNKARFSNIIATLRRQEKDGAPS